MDRVCGCGHVQTSACRLDGAGQGIVTTPVALEPNTLAQQNLLTTQNLLDNEGVEMAEASGFVHIVDDVPELEGRIEGPVLIHTLAGFLDAGNAASLAGKHLLAHSLGPVSYTHLRAHETDSYLVCRLLLE